MSKVHISHELVVAPDASKHDDTLATPVAID